MNINRMKNLGENRSAIRDLSEYANMRKAQIGADNVFDFSIGNPNVAPPKEVKECLAELLECSDPLSVHGYTTAAGDFAARKVIADELNSRFGTHFSAENLYMTAGASASLVITLSSVVNDGDEVITFAPYFPEYKVFAETAGAVFRVVSADMEKFQIDFDGLSKTLNKKTKAVIINSPNNPSGAILTKATLEQLSEMLLQKEKELGHKIYLISDEPYRELVYGGAQVEFASKYYKDTVICYSYSKSLSLPGERIGYILINPDMEGFKELYSTVCGAGRALGYVCAPSIFQHMLTKCNGITSDIGIYEKNRDILYKALTDFGFDAVHPDGAFYLFVKSPSGSGEELCERAKKYEIIVVPSDSFGVSGYVRISYCVSQETIEKSLPAFEKLAKEYF